MEPAPPRARAIILLALVAAGCMLQLYLSSERIDSALNPRTYSNSNTPFGHRRALRTTAKPKHTLIRTTTKHTQNSGVKQRNLFIALDEFKDPKTIEQRQLHSIGYLPSPGQLPDDVDQAMDVLEQDLNALNAEMKPQDMNHGPGSIKNILDNESPAVKKDVTTFRLMFPLIAHLYDMLSGDKAVVQNAKEEETKAMQDAGMPQPQFSEEDSAAYLEANSNTNQDSLPLGDQLTPKQQAIIDAPPYIDEQEIIDGDIPPYNVDNALATIEGFRSILFFFIYDSTSNEFVIVHNIPSCTKGCARIHRCAAVVAHALKKNFPDRFKGLPEGADPGQHPQGDMVFMMSTGDAPRIHNYCLSANDNYCHSTDFAPIFHFGSVFDNTNFLPSMIAMPNPGKPHMKCFDDWQSNQLDKLPEERTVCQDLQPKTRLRLMGKRDGLPPGGLTFGEELGLLENDNYWNELIPQIIWRGTDFQFLHIMFPNMRAPTYMQDIAPYANTIPPNGTPEDDQRWAINTLWENMGKAGELTPRWRGVLLTSMAELNTREHQAKTGEAKLPWVDIKFSSVSANGEKIAAEENPEYINLAKLGVTAIGRHENMTMQARYKYHLDLGGGGGTTWTGTLEKLALPGVLFHHVTPTKDWFHDLLKPWVHYIPIKMDLSDLREKCEWAEAHPQEAQEISQAGTDFARWMGSVDGFDKLYREKFLFPLRDVVRSYKPMPPRFMGRTVLDVVMEQGKERKFEVVGRCSGMHSDSCEKTTTADYYLSVAWRDLTMFPEDLI